jgi:transcriptional regulator with XRE-family HTH domain
MATLGAIIANNVRGERARRRLRQLDVAEALGWPLSSYGDLETGRRKVSADDLPQLCEVLGVTLNDLLRGADAEDLRRMGI